MKVITERSLIRGVAQRWRMEYAHPRWKDRWPTADKLAALDPEKATAAEVAAIIGNGSWTDVPECGECGNKAPAVVEIGEEPDYESSTAYVCESCLRASLAALEGMTP